MFEVAEGRITEVAIVILGAYEPQLLGDDQLEKFRAYFPTSRYAMRKSR